ncbi:MAG: hypothetical protein HY047_21075 [Acidobacteria bacterium]|nr:hypothetical protein [Acidobacteriota bacterium]
MTDRELAIARSVIYASLFEYPLTLDQLHFSLIESEQTPEEILAVFDGSELLQHIIEYRDGFFFPAGRDDLLAERRRRETRSRAFLDRHRRLLQMLCALPFARTVALSGSIGHLNLEADGDLDLFIVTSGRRAWTVMLAAIVLTRVMGRRREMCINFILADSHLRLEQQDLFAANQVIHLKPLIGAEVLTALREKNPFVARIYPNATTDRSRMMFSWTFPRWLARAKRALELALHVPAPFVEAACRHLYGWHLRRRAATWRSPDQVLLQSDYLKLHTRSHRHAVLERFDAAVERALRHAERSRVRRAAGGRR